MNILSVYLIGILFAFASSTDHAIYISVVEITQEPSDSLGSVKVKLFTDDLEDAIFASIGQRYNLSKGCDKGLNDIAGYISSHLSLKINEMPVKLAIRNCEKMDVSLWLEFEFDAIDLWQQVEIQGDQLMELFPTQSNVFTVKYNGQNRMFRLTNNKKTELLEF